MGLPPLRDLSEHRDVKGGSPRTPSGGVRVADYQEYSGAMNGNHASFWKALATGQAGLIVGLILAYFTALQSKGVTQKEMQDYDKEYSIYAQAKEGISQRNQTQDNQIGTLQGIQQTNITKLSAHDTKLHDDEKDILELQGKVKRFGDFIEEQWKAKK